MIVMIHRGCNGHAVETDTLITETCTIPADSFPITCFTCLEEIWDESEVRFSEEIRM